MNKLIVVVLLLGLLGCQSEEKTEETLYADYKIRYLEESGELKVEAKFKLMAADSSLKSFQPSTGVAFANMPLYFKSVQGIKEDYYETVIRKSLRKDMAFHFLNEKDEAVSQPIQYAPMHFMHVEGDEIKLDSGFTLVWKGENLMPGDELIVLMETQGEGKPKKIVYTGATSKPRLYYRPEQLAHLKKNTIVKIDVMKMHYKRYPQTDVVRGAYTLEYYFKSFVAKVK